ARGAIDRARGDLDGPPREPLAPGEGEGDAQARAQVGPRRLERLVEGPRPREVLPSPEGGEPARERRLGPERAEGTDGVLPVLLAEDRPSVPRLDAPLAHGGERLLARERRLVERAVRLGRLRPRAERLEPPRGVPGERAGGHAQEAPGEVGHDGTQP